MIETQGMTIMIIKLYILPLRFTMYNLFLLRAWLNAYNGSSYNVFKMRLLVFRLISSDVWGLLYLHIIVQESPNMVGSEISEAASR